MQRVREHSTDDGTPLVYSFWLKPYGALYFTLRGYGVPFIGGPGKITGYTDEPVPDVTTQGILYQGRKRDTRDRATSIHYV